MTSTIVNWQPLSSPQWISTPTDVVGSVGITRYSYYYIQSGPNREFTLRFTTNRPSGSTYKFEYNTGTERTTTIGGPGDITMPSFGSPGEPVIVKVTVTPPPQ